ncbi:M20 aminoacylase family protein [Oricola indica]|jgi:amidohydrolase|uniref:M20 aminoacylase family protein n=1 Tax=Oricola indica TaxID=2872591 RepID=UPI001CBBFA01|nr:M20 aminoacylase family protein [Oricola indica]
METARAPETPARASLPEDLCRQMGEWRHDLHRNPELGFSEKRTSGIIAAHLRSAGIAVHEGVGGTGIVGVLQRGTGSGAIAIRAEMDALPIPEENDFGYASATPDTMHACGHDGHASMLLGAALYLARQGTFDGTAVFIFQPDEENGRGARAMISDGLFERFPIDAIYALHNLPGLAPGRVAVRSGAVMACEDTFRIELTGKGTHAAMPHRGVDPIVAGAQVVSALQTIVSREMDPVESAVVSVTDFMTSGVRNVIPGQVVITGDARSYSPQTGDVIDAAMRRIASGIAAAHRAECAVRYNREFTATINTPREADIVARLAATLFGADEVDADCPPLLASDDFGAFLEHRPGAYFFLGNGTDGSNGRALHNPRYDFNDDILARGAEFWTRLIETRLPA